MIGWLVLLACAEPRRSGAPPSDERTKVWAPGDPVPGWDDADCSLPEVGNRFEIRGLDAWEVIGTLDARAGVADVAAVQVELRDCTRFPCTAGDDIPPGDPYTSFRFSTEVDDGQLRGLGWYGPDRAITRPVAGDVYGVVGLGHSGGLRGNMPNIHVSACISRARPDEIAGVVQYQFYKFGDPAPIYWYPTLTMWSSFDVVLGDHAGVLLADDGSFLSDDGEELPMDSLPEAVQAHHWRYRGVSYDDAWPWELIDDPDVRDAVYERYTPEGGG